jgi:hypothetical protein
MYILTVSMPRKMKETETVENNEKKKNVDTGFMKILKWKDVFGSIGVVGRIVIKWVLVNKYIEHVNLVLDAFRWQIHKIIAINHRNP